jgi:uncharacterized Zn finger protein (UPF0148 family)
VAAQEPRADLCPSCGRNPIEDEGTAFCSSCSDNWAVEAYREKDAPVIEARRSDWKVRSQSAAAARERQRRHRLREAVRPTEPAGEWVDPWEVAKKALDDLRRVRLALRSQATARAHVEDVAEAIRVLAWGRSQRRALALRNLPLWSSTSPLLVGA